MKLIAAFAVFAAFAFMLYGWGWAARRALRAGSKGWPATVAAGMAAVVFLGGVLNLARLAHPWALACVVIVGVGLGIAAAVSGERPSVSFVALIPAVAVVAFVVLTQLPPRAYNFHDDYQKYFVHPVRMLETGTVFGSPLNDIGLDTLGGQAFLDGFAVAFFPIRYINGVDAAFALFLCMMLASQFGRELPVLAVVFINPQYVNISALYTGSLLMMAAIEDAGASAAITGMFHAALVALKSTFLLFVAVHLAAALWARGVKWTARTAGFGALFLAPWILLHLPRYLGFLHAGPGIPDTGVRPNESFNIFSIHPLDYGSTPLHYTALMIAAGICGWMILCTKRKEEKHQADMTAASCFALVAAYLIMVYVSGPRNAGYAQAIRYFTPFAIGVFPVVFSGMGKYRWLAAIPVLAFAPSLRDRAEQAIQSGSVLAFSWLAPDPDYLEYNRQVLYGDVKQRVEAAQAKVPAGEETVVWINAPFYLNSARNRLADVEPGAGLIAPWSKIPDDARYFIFEYGGYANMDESNYVEEMAEGPDFMRRVSAARLKMTRQLTDLMQRSEKLYDDGSIATFVSRR